MVLSYINLKMQINKFLITFISKLFRKKTSVIFFTVITFICAHHSQAQKAYEFTPNERVVLPNLGNSISDITSFTLEFWIKLKVVSSKIHFVQIDVTGNNIRNGGFGIENGHMVASLQTDFNTDLVKSTVAATLAVNIWHHLAYVYNNGVWSFYFNGTQLGVAVSDPLSTSATPNYPSNTNLVLGDATIVGNFPYGFSGTMDEVRLWNESRSVTDISNNKDNELTGVQANLIGYWKLNEVTGQKVFDSEPPGAAPLFNGFLGDSDLEGVHDPDIGKPGAPVVTACAPPIAPASNVLFEATNENSVVLKSFAPPGTGAAGYIVVISTGGFGTPPTSLPSANPVYTGTGEQVVSVGTSNSPNVLVTGLTANTLYYFKIYSYNNCGGMPTFETTGLTVFTTTACSAAPVGLTKFDGAMPSLIGNISGGMHVNRATALWDCWRFEVNTTGDKVLVELDGGGAVTGSGTDLMVKMKKARNTGSLMNAKIKSNEGNEFKLHSLQLRYEGTGTGSLTIKGYRNGNIISGATHVETFSPSTWQLFDLAPNPHFHNIDEIRITYTGTNDILAIQVDEINTTAPCFGPTEEATSINLGAVTTNTVTVASYTPPGVGATGYVIKVNTTGVGTFTAPTDGTLPTANTTYGGSEQVVYVGTSASPNVTVTNLNAGATYYFKVYAYNNCGMTSLFESTRNDNTVMINTVAKPTPTITFADITKTFGDPAFDLAATTNSTGAITYTVDGAANGTTLSGKDQRTVTLGNAGTVTIRVTVAEDDNFAKATQDIKLTINKADQTITFDALTAKNQGDANFTLTATTSSGLNVSYTSSHPEVATVAGNVVTIVGVGSTTITATQAGNNNYNAASNVAQTLQVNQFLPPSAPSNTQIVYEPKTNPTPTGNGDQVLISWQDAATNEQGFYVRRSIRDINDFKNIDTLPANTTTYRDIIRVKNAQYYYQIVAFNAAGESVSTIFSFVLVGVDELTPLKKYIVVYPNPVIHKFKIQLGTSLNGEIKVRLLDTSGRLVKNLGKMDVQALKNKNFDILAISPGSYLLEFSTGGRKANLRVLKK